MKPSPAELIILKLLWTEGRLSAREIHEQIAGQLSWSYSSSRKTIDRMVTKEMLQVEDVHGIMVFSAAVNKLDTIAAMTKDFAATVLGIEGTLPVASFSGSKVLTDEELEELQKMLEEGEAS
jgi:predicted transcriptional regulator